MKSAAGFLCRAIEVLCRVQELRLYRGMAQNYCSRAALNAQWM